MTTSTASDRVWSDAADGFRRWSAGDEEGLTLLVRTMSPMLWHVVRAYGLDRSRAEDVVQSTFLVLVRKRDIIQDPQAVGAWLTRTARREAWRVARRDDREEPAGDEDLETGSPVRVSAEAEALRQIEKDLLWQAVGRLSDRCQRLLRVAAFSPRPNYTELAEDLGMPVGSIGPTRRRCLDKLRDLLACAPEAAR